MRVSFLRVPYLFDHFFASFAYEHEAFVHVGVEEIQEILGVQGTEFRFECSAPRFDVRTPSNVIRIDVNHTATEGQKRKSCRNT